jgi:hypothetical protein
MATHRTTPTTLLDALVKGICDPIATTSKWYTSTNTIQVGDLVLLVEENLPPLNWKMGRIIEVHPGKDNRVRVVTVKTASGTTKRTVNKVCVLPKDE